MTYADIDFDAVTTIDQLAEIFNNPPYNPLVDARDTLYETAEGIKQQFDMSPRNNYENAAMVLYIDRTKQPDGPIEIKSMWFDEAGNKTARPVRSTADGE